MGRVLKNIDAMLSNMRSAIQDMKRRLKNIGLMLSNMRSVLNNMGFGLQNMDLMLWNMGSMFQSIFSARGSIGKIKGRCDARRGPITLPAEAITAEGVRGTGEGRRPAG